uniref:Cation channel sperm-associated targeting subunit tau C2 domain-containing protein n=1 Tax=Sphenodon punctatus TaxID=8508 RepID=A0A8D0G7N6_SPHPU
KFKVHHNIYLLIRIIVNKIMKCTNLQVYKPQLKASKKDVVIHFEDVKYFSVKVPMQRHDEQNRIILELVGFQDPKDFPRLLGTAAVHLYEVIQVGMIKTRLWIFCVVEVEFMFSYGNFGYGYSHQIELQKTAGRSMFIRIPPPKDRTDPER